MGPVLFVLVLAFSDMHAMAAERYTATYVPGPSSLPDKSQDRQVGTNRCGTNSHADSLCQNLYINSATDFCLWAPKGPKAQGIGDAEREVVSYCTKSGRGTRLIPPGTIKSVHFVRTPHYVQISGLGDFSKLFIGESGGGGELDPHGADGLGNPIGGLVFSNAFGHRLVQMHEWNSFVDSKSYCLRACRDGDRAASYCKNIYDELGCNFNMPTGPDHEGAFESCEGQDADIVGVYTNSGVVSTFYESQMLTGAPIPPAKAPPPVSRCSRFPSSLLEQSLRLPFAHAAKGVSVIGTSKSRRTSSSRSFSRSSTSSSSRSSSSSSTLSTSSTSSSSSVSPTSSVHFTPPPVTTVVTTSQASRDGHGLLHLDNAAASSYRAIPMWVLLFCTATALFL